MYFSLAFFSVVSAHMFMGLRQWIDIGGRYGRALTAVDAAILGGTVLAIVLAIEHFLSPGPKSMDQPEWFVWATLLLGGSGLVAFTARLIIGWLRKESGASYETAIMVWATIGSLYLVGTTLDHWWFFRGTQAGVTFTEFLDIKDSVCERPLLLRMEGDTAYPYRCPEFIFFNSPDTMGFAPWPHYRAGESAELKAAIDEMMRSAVRL